MASWDAPSQAILCGSEVDADLRTQQEIARMQACFPAQRSSAGALRDYVGQSVEPRQMGKDEHKSTGSWALSITPSESVWTEQVNADANLQERKYIYPCNVPSGPRNQISMH